MKRVTLTDFRRHLAAHLRADAAGETLVLTRRGQPVARLEPMLALRPAERPFSDLANRRYKPLGLSVSSTELLRADRRPC